MAKPIPKGYRKSISTDFSLALMAVIAAVLIGFAVVAGFLAVGKAERRLQGSLASYQALAGSALASSVWNFDTRTVQGFVAALLRDEEVVLAKVTSEGSVLAQGGQETLLDRPLGDVLADPSLLSGGLDLVHEGETIGRFTVVLSREGIRQSAWAQIGQIATVTVLILMAIAVVSFMVAGHFVAKPLQRLQALAARIAEGRLDQPVAAYRDDELGALSGSLERMRRSLKKLLGDLREANEDLAEANRTLEARVEERTEELTQANSELQDANRMIVDSIRYASRIQEAVLPSPEVLGRAVDSYFLMWEPRDLVGGDFVWFHNGKTQDVIIVGDCTGHGVPGAFMTLIAGTLLDRMFAAPRDSGPAEVLGALNSGLKRILSQEEPSPTPLATDMTDDGMDAAVCMVDRTAGRMRYAGARLSLWRSCDGEIDEIKGDKLGLGYRRSPMQAQFTEHELTLDRSQAFYLATDGIIDQVGGARSMSFGRKRFRRALAAQHNRDMAAQGAHLQQIFKDYQGGQIRRDDVTVLGFSTAGAGM